MSTNHHTLIVGGGTAGCVVASRLSREANRRITIIEAGSVSQHTSADVRRGSMLLAAIPNHPATWTYDVELRPGRQHQLTRGRLMGGSMAINGGYFVRATPADFEEWSRYGGPAWSYKQVMGPLRRLENDLDYPHSDLHGNAGPIQIARAAGGEVHDALQGASHSLGFSAEEDKNAATPPGFGPIPSTVIDGDRRSSADGYLTPLPPNITVLTDSRVRRIVVETQGDGEATIRGVETTTGPIASDDVIVAAGAIESARLLMASGIGPADHLRDQGIDVVQNLPVGVGFSDHPTLPIAWLSRKTITGAPNGPAFSAALNASAHNVDDRLPDSPWGDVELLFPQAALDYLLTGIHPPDPMMHVLITMQKNASRGHLRLNPHDTDSAPLISYNYLGERQDILRSRAAVRLTHELLHTAEMGELFDRYIGLDSQVIADDHMLDSWIAQHVTTAVHTCATAPMGQVVDGQGRVYGVNGLRIADTSILPSTPSRGPANTAVLIGELISDAVMNN